jgi:hypothetical protein
MVLPVVVIMRSPALPEEQRHELARHANLVADPPEGLLLQARAEHADEAELSFEVWETPEHHERFLAERMLPAARRFAEESGRSECLLPETLTSLCVVQPGIAARMVDDFGDEVTKVTSL